MTRRESSQLGPKVVEKACLKPCFALSMLTVAPPTLHYELVTSRKQIPPTQGVEGCGCSFGKNN